MATKIGEAFIELFTRNEKLDAGMAASATALTVFSGRAATTGIAVNTGLVVPISNATTALTLFGGAAVTTGLALNTRLLVSVNNAALAFRNLSNETVRLNINWDRITNQLITLGAAMTAIGFIADRFIGRPLRRAFASSVVAAAASIEAMNRLKVAFGDNVPAIQEWSKELADATNLSARALAENTGQFGLIFSAMNFTQKQAAELSKIMVTLGVDMSSIADIPLQEAFKKLEAGIAGESEPLRRMGIDIRDVTLAQFALSQGITTAVTAMTQQEKTLLRARAIFQQTAIMQGDAARTAGDLANVMKQFADAVEDVRVPLGDLIGEAILPFIAVGTELLQIAAAIAKEFNKQHPIIKRVTVAILALVTVIPLLILGFGSLILSLALLRVAAIKAGIGVNILTISLARLRAMLGIIAVALVLLSFLLELFIDTGGDTTKMMEEMEEELKNIEGQMVKTGRASKGLGNSFNVVGEIGRKAFAKLGVTGLGTLALSAASTPGAGGAPTSGLLTGVGGVGATSGTVSNAEGGDTAELIVLRKIEVNTRGGTVFG